MDTTIILRQTKTESMTVSVGQREYNEAKRMLSSRIIFSPEVMTRIISVHVQVYTLLNEGKNVSYFCLFMIITKRFTK